MSKIYRQCDCAAMHMVLSTYDVLEAWLRICIVLHFEANKRRMIVTVKPSGGLPERDRCEKMSP